MSAIHVAGTQRHTRENKQLTEALSSLGRVRTGTGNKSPTDSVNDAGGFESKESGRCQAISRGHRIDDQDHGSPAVSRTEIHEGAKRDRRVRPGSEGQLLSGFDGDSHSRSYVSCRSREDDSTHWSTPPVRPPASSSASRAARSGLCCSSLPAATRFPSPRRRERAAPRPSISIGP